MKKIITYSALALIGINTSALSALEYEVTLGAAAEHSDNILLTNTDERSDTERSVQASFNIQQQSELIETDIDYRAERIDYAKDSNDDQTVIVGSAAVNLTLIPRAITWRFSNLTQNLRRDLSETDIQSNRENRNIFATGPDLSYRASSVDTINLRPLYIATRFEDTDNNDNDRISVNLNWAHRLSGGRAIELGATQSETDFDDPTTPDLETKNVYIAYASKLSTADLAIKLGHNEVKYEQAEKVDGPLIEISYDLQSASQELAIFATHLVTDSTIGIGNTSATSGGDITDTDNNFDDIDIVTRAYGRIRYLNNTVCSVCTVSMSLIYDDQDFETLNNDETSLTSEIGFNYRFRTNLNAQFSLARESIDFNNSSNRNDDVDSVSIRLNYTPYPDLSVYMTVRQEERDSNVIAARYDEFRSGLGVSYRFN